MAGTPVRRLGWSFVAIRTLPHDWRLRTAALAERKFDADLLLLAIVIVQFVISALLITRNALDLEIAACLSTGLLAAAALYASRRIAGAAPNRPPRETAGVSQAIAAARVPQTHLDQLRAPEAWADLMARISHEIRTPLNAVIGFSDLMEREIFGPLGHARYDDYAAHIKDSGEALLKSAEDTLALSSLLAPPRAGDRPNIFDLNDLLRDAWRPLETEAARRGISMSLAGSGRMDAHGERRVCRQAILNLLTEALNRAADSDRIKVSAHAEHDAIRLSITTATASQWRHETTPSLAVCLARTLLEHAGSPLTVSEDRLARTWTAVTMLDRPIQHDLFSGRA